MATHMKRSLGTVSSAAARSVHADVLLKAAHPSFVARTAADMEAFGKLLGSKAKAGHTILLQGKLGVGKTVFARGFVRGATGDDNMEVLSPTFLLDNSYIGRGQTVVHHMDMYRIRHPSELTPLGLSSVFRYDIAIIEWPQRMGEVAPADHLLVSIATEEDVGYASAVGGGWSGTHVLAHSQFSGSVASHQFGNGEYEVDEDTLSRSITLVPRGAHHTALANEVAAAEAQLR